MALKIQVASRPGEGKSMVARLIARCLAMNGITVDLVDDDRPNFEKIARAPSKSELAFLAREVVSIETTRVKRGETIPMPSKGQIVRITPKDLRRLQRILKKAV